jgi:hypothetical protein
VREAAPFYDRAPAAAIALLRSSLGVKEDDAALMDLLRRTENTKNRVQWLALASHLGHLNAFHRHLQDQVRFVYAIEVIDDIEYQPVQAFAGSRIRGVIGGVLGRAPDHWPHETRYCLTLSPRGGDSVLVATPLTVYIRQDESTANGPYCDPGDWKEHQRDVLRTLYSVAFCNMCPSASRSVEYPDILGGSGQIVYHSREQVQYATLNAAEQYLKECRAFMDAVENELLVRVPVSRSALGATTRSWQRWKSRLWIGAAINRKHFRIQAESCATWQLVSSSSQSGFHTPA